MNATPPTETGIRPVVAVLNSADDVIEMLRVALEDSGFAVVSAKLSEIQSGVMDLVAFVSAHRPAAIVYDLPRPYEANWNFLRLLRETAWRRGPSGERSPHQSRWHSRPRGGR